MRILFTIDHLYLHGGAEKVLTERANYFVEHFGYDVYLLTTEQKSRPFCYKLDERIKTVDLEINYERTKSYISPANLFKLPRHYFRLRKAIKEINPDIIAVLNFAFDFYFVPYIFKSTPKIKEYHSSGVFNFSASQKSRVKKWIYGINDFFRSRYDKILLLNPDEKQFYNTSNTAIIPNPLQLTDKVASLENLNAISAGRVAPIKGFESLIRAWRIVANAEPDWHLTIYGHGEDLYVASLKKLVQENHLEKNVSIKPAINNLQDEMAQSSVYVMSSVSECFPMVLIESLAVGLPVVSYDCPTGPRNIITDNEDGLLARDQDIEQLAAKIVLLTQSRSLRKTMGENARRNIGRFSQVKVMEQWRNLLENLKK